MCMLGENTGPHAAKFEAAIPSLSVNHIDACPHLLHQDLAQKKLNEQAETDKVLRSKIGTFVHDAYGQGTCADRRKEQEKQTALLKKIYDGTLTSPSWSFGLRGSETRVRTSGPPIALKTTAQHFEGLQKLCVA